MPARLKSLIPSSIRHKLILAAVTCIVVPAIVSLILYNSLTKEALRQQAVSNASDALQLVRGSVTNLLLSKINIANYIQMNSGLNSYFKQVVSGNEDPDPYRRFMESNRVLEHLDSLTVVGEKSYVTVILENGSYYMNYSVSDYNPLDYRQRPWFGQISELQGLESLWTEPEATMFRSDQIDHPTQLSVVRTLRLPDSEIYGYVIVTFMEDQISGIFNSLSEGNDMVLLDAKGTIVSGSHQSQIGTTFAYLDDLDQEKPYSIVPVKGEKQLMVHQDIPFAGWRLVLMQPYKDAIVNINSIFNRVFWFQMCFFLIFLLLLIALVRAFTKPLVKLGKVATSVQRGNLDVRSNVHGNDEVGRLGHLFDDMLDRFKAMISEISENQARKRKAELRMLQAQIHPHFLFNVLNSIRMKVMKRGDPESAKMIGSLSVLLRMTISREEDEIALHEEIDLISHYVALMNLRQKEEVRLELDIAPEAFLFKVPRFFLQPIVENALIHGLNQQAGTIRIAADMKGRHLVLAVKDDGIGMDAAMRESIARRIQGGSAGSSMQEEASGGGFSHIGLQNVMERMSMVFGEAFQCHVYSEPGQGTVIEMYIPERGNADV
ncbi:sensor histidine kinase [Paenibacillus sp. CR_12]|uniref:cache domain-containing sensor histidine kinase n=1 Tax=Paenibacillus sp. CR_12 TaxID=3055793 RepID=UPI0035C25F31